MKFRFLYFSVLIICITSIFISCSSTSSDNPVDNNQLSTAFHSLKVGNYWIFENYSIDSVGNKASTAVLDSTVITNSEKKLGIDCFVLKSFNSKGEEVDVRYCYEDSLTYFMHSKFINDKIQTITAAFGINIFNIGERWMKLADYSLSTWPVFSDSVRNVQLTSTYFVNGLITITGSKGTTKSFVINSQTLNLQEFILTFQFNGTISGITGTKTFQLRIHSWFDKNAGLLLQTFESTKFEVFTGLSFPFQGNEKKAVNYKIVK